MPSIAAVQPLHVAAWIEELARPPLRAYIDAAGIVEDRKGFLFRTSRGHAGVVLSEQPMSQPDAWRMRGCPVRC